MFKFDKEQEVFDFAGVKMGGQPGEYPTVLAGTIFYGGHNILNDELTGDFDKDRAEQLVNDMASISDVTVLTLYKFSDKPLKHFQNILNILEKFVMLHSL